VWNNTDPQAHSSEIFPGSQETGLYSKTVMVGCGGGLRVNVIADLFQGERMPF